MSVVESDRPVGPRPLQPARSRPAGGSAPGGRGSEGAAGSPAQQAVLDLQRHAGNRATAGAIRAARRLPLQRELSGVAEMFGRAEKGARRADRRRLNAAAEPEGVGELFRGAANDTFAATAGQRATAEAQTLAPRPYDHEQRQQLGTALAVKRRLGPMPEGGLSATPGPLLGASAPAPRGPTPLLDSHLGARDAHRQAVGAALGAEGEKNAKAAAELKVSECRELAAARRYESTPDEPEEYRAVLRLLAANSYGGVEAALAAVRRRAKASLDLAAATRRGVDVARATSDPVYKASYLTAAAEAADRAIAEQDWVAAPGLASTLAKQAAVVLEARPRLDAIKLDLEALQKEKADYEAATAAPRRGRRGAPAPTPPVLDLTKSSNLTGWIAEHEREGAKDAGASELVALTRGSSRPSLVYIEDKIQLYKDSAKANARDEADRRAAAEAATAAEAARAAERARLRDAGRIAGNGTVIPTKTLAELGVEERAAVEGSLTPLRSGGPIPALSHPNGAKWGAAFGNRDSDLPLGRTYQEYYVERDPASTSYHGERRLVRSGDRIYYTSTHYGQNGVPAFVLLALS